MKLPPALLAAALALAVPASHAQTQAAGLWEHSFTVKSQGGELEKALTTEVNGKAQQVHTETAGKWLAADCGDVKPRALPAKPQALTAQ
jgi:hypothetical protein